MKMEANMNKMQKQLNLRNAKLQMLMGKPDAAGTKAKNSLLKPIDFIKAKRAAWYGFKVGILVAWSDFKIALKETIND